MDFNFRTVEYLKSLDSVLIQSQYEIVGFDWKNELVFINKVDHWRKRNGKIAKVYHHFRTAYQIPKEMVKWHRVTKKGMSTSWVWADDPYYTYEVDERYISRGDARKLLEIRNSLPMVNSNERKKVTKISSGV